jgi:DNA-binding response OmpR family regulator
MSQDCLLRVYDYPPAGSFGIFRDEVKRILVVEDDPAVQRALRRLFESEDFQVEITADGKAGLEACRSSAPAAVVLDLRLPGIPGNDVCREIKKQAPSLPVIVLSAKTDVADKVLLLELGADDYVTKPFSPQELLARVRAALRRRSHADLGEVFVFGKCHCRLRPNGNYPQWPGCLDDGTGVQAPEILCAESGTRYRAQ